MKIDKTKIIRVVLALGILHFAYLFGAYAQETPPAPAAPKE